MMLHLLIRRLATAAAIAAMVVLLVPGLAFGHAELETATPADKSTVTEPVEEVAGIYSEAMTPNGSSLVVKDSTGAVVARGTVDPEDDTRMVATPATPLGNGAYRVESTSVATDGHVEHATWTFTVAVAATPSPPPEVTPAPTVAASSLPSATPAPVPATPAPSAGPTPVPSGDGSTTGSGGDVVLPIIVALVVLGAGAAYLLTRRNRPTDGV